MLWAKDWVLICRFLSVAIVRKVRYSAGFSFFFNFDFIQFGGSNCIYTLWGVKSVWVDVNVDSPSRSSWRWCLRWHISSCNLSFDLTVEVILIHIKDLSINLLSGLLMGVLELGVRLVRGFRFVVGHMGWWVVIFIYFSLIWVRQYKRLWANKIQFILFKLHQAELDTSIHLFTWVN